LEEQITMVLYQAKSRTKTEAERIALLERASQLENKKVHGDIAIAQQKLALAQKELDSIATTAVAYDDAARKSAVAEAALVGLRTESINLQEKITNRRNALLDGDTATRFNNSLRQREKIREEAAKAQRDYELQLMDLKVANIADEGERTRAQIQVNYQSEVEDLAAQGLMTFELLDELQKERDAALVAADEADAKRKEDKKQKDQDAAIKQGDEELDLETQRIMASADMVFAADSVKEERLYQLKKNSLENNIKLLEANGKADST